MADPTPHLTSRRAVLAGLGTAAAATTLAACAGGSSNDSSSTSSDTAAPGQAAPSPSGSASGSAPAGGGTSLGSTADIPVGGGKIFQEQQVVVTQPTQGDLKCFTAVCTHMGCIVHDVTGDAINCACHGSKYNIANGDVIQGPAQRPLAPEKITVSGNSITLNS
jgi:Rieske Fe-S protein